MTVASAKPKRMTMPGIREHARNLGITPGKMKKAELIHSIQIAEFCTPCYGRSNGECPWGDCAWRSDCFKTNA